MYKLKSRWFRL